MHRFWKFMSVLIVQLLPAYLAALPLEPVRMRFLAETEVVVPGEPFEVGAYFEIDPPWHIYWKDPGDAGLPTKLSLTVPDGFGSGPIQWPSHKQFTQPGGIIGYGYDANVLFPAQISPPTSLSLGAEIHIKLKASWLRCSPTLCVPGKASEEITLTVGSKSKPIHQDLFREAPSY